MFTNFFISTIGLISFVSGQCSTPGSTMTVTGIVMDNFCIERGTLLDKPSIKTLENPYEHTIHCLIDVPQCIQSKYALLMAPKSTGGLWTVAYQLETEGTELIIEEAKKLRERGVIQNLTLTLSGVVESNRGSEPFLRCIQIVKSSGSNSSGSGSSGSVSGSGSGSSGSTKPNGSNTKPSGSGSSGKVQLFRAAHGALMLIIGSSWLYIRDL